MKDFWYFVRWGLAVVAFFAIIGFAINVANLSSYKFWGPKRETAKREVFENSTSYVHGKQQYLSRLKLEWSTAKTDNSRGAICATARHEASTLKPEDIPANLQNWECIK